MPNWSKQSKLVRTADTVSGTISVLRVWVQELSDKKLKSYIQSSFRTLNNPNRYKYFWQMDTVTFEKLIVFLVCLEEICRRGKDGDWYYHAINDLNLNTSKAWITLYYVMKLYKLKHSDLFEIDLAVDKDRIDDLLNNSNTTGYEFKDTNYYDYLEIVKDCLKRIKKGNHNTDDANTGNIITELYTRRSVVDESDEVKKSDKKKKGKSKKTVKLPGYSW